MSRSFDSLGAFAAHLGRLIRTAPAAERRAVDKGSELFLEAVKAIPGHYQDGWPALAESTQDERVRLGYTADDPLKRTGKFADSFEREILDDRKAVVGTADNRALAFEFGHGPMPPRPVIAAAAAQQNDHIAHVMATIIHKHLAGHEAQD